MKTKHILWIALGLIVGNLIFSAIPVRATTTPTEADADTYGYTGSPSHGMDTWVNFGKMPGETAVGFFHFPFTNKPAAFSSAVIVISYNYADADFVANVSLVSATWDEVNLEYGNMPAAGPLLCQPTITTTGGTYINITINVTSTILAMSGKDGISIRMESNDTMVSGYGTAISKEGCIDTDYCPVLIWTYEEFPWYYVVLIVLAIGVVSVIIIFKKTRSSRVAASAPAKVTPAVPAAKENPSPQESPGPEEPKF